MFHENIEKLVLKYFDVSLPRPLRAAHEPATRVLRRSSWKYFELAFSTDT
jgi:hypothetical protein